MTCRVGHSAAIRTSYWKIDRPAPRECPRPGVTGAPPVVRRPGNIGTLRRRTREPRRGLDQTIEGLFPANNPASSNPNRDDQSALEPQRPRDRMTRRRSGNAVL